MQQLDILTSALQLNAGLVQRALDGLSDDDLAKRPNDQCNPIGWTLWHQYRYEDGVVSLITGEPQAWLSGGWRDKFGMPADDDNLGMGDPLEQVGAFRATLDNLQGYGAAVREKTLACLQAITPDDLERELEAPGGATPHGGRPTGRSDARPFFTTAAKSATCGDSLPARVGSRPDRSPENAKGRDDARPLVLVAIQGDDEMLAQSVGIDGFALLDALDSDEAPEGAARPARDRHFCVFARTGSAPCHARPRLGPPLFTEPVFPHRVMELPTMLAALRDVASTDSEPDPAVDSAEFPAQIRSISLLACRLLPCRLA